ncbi:MAG TPA: hypothetical protein VGO17_08755 [Aurantimonas sp.]|nr:hypothetical protein [Aurantimonas sp.]
MSDIEGRKATKSGSPGSEGEETPSGRRQKGNSPDARSEKTGRESEEPGFDGVAIDPEAVKHDGP